MNNTPMTDKMAEKIAAMGVERAVEVMMARDRACRNATKGELSSGYIFHLRQVAVVGCGMLGITVNRTEFMNHIEEVIMPKVPVSEYLDRALDEVDPVSKPGLPEDISGHGYYDPCEQALINSGRLKDV